MRRREARRGTGRTNSETETWTVGTLQAFRWTSKEASLYSLDCNINKNKNAEILPCCFLNCLQNVGHCICIWGS
jgi:hypothetical protein